MAFDTSSDLPSEKAARFRLYDIISSDDSSDKIKLKNHENISFTCDKSDIIRIGKFDTTINLTTMESITNKVNEIDGFFWLRFRKVDGSIRSMYCMKMKDKISGNLNLRDLSCPNTEIRSCIMSNIIDFIWNNTHYCVSKRILKRKRK